METQIKENVPNSDNLAGTIGVGNVDHEKESPNPNKRWYEQHKQELSEDRKKRYREDPEYRQQRIDASRMYRAGELSPPIPAGLLSLKEAAQRIGAGVSTIRGWRRMHLHKEKLLPEPQVFKGRPFFTEEQVQLLGQLKDFFKKYRMRSPKISQPILAELRAFIFANWN